MTKSMAVQRRFLAELAHQKGACRRCWKMKAPRLMRRALTLAQAKARGFDPERLMQEGRWPVTVPSTVCVTCHAARQRSTVREIERAVDAVLMRESEAQMLKLTLALRSAERRRVGQDNARHARAQATWVPVLRALKRDRPDAHAWALNEQYSGAARLVRRLDGRRGPVAVAELVSPSSAYALTLEEALVECRKYGWRDKSR